jgi:hypothetical protein
MSATETRPAPREMTLRQFLATHPDYRTVTREPSRCWVLRRVNGAGTELQPVRIVEDIVAKLEAQTAEGYLVVEAGTSSLGDQAPYFSLTATLYRSKFGARRESDSSFIAGGCLHDEALAAFPQLAPIEALHLADAITGEPMHAEANGWYAYSGETHEYERESRYHSEPTDTPLERSARALRIDVAELEPDMDREAFAAFVESLRPRWAREAAHGIELLNALAPPAKGKPSPNGTLIDMAERG